MQSKPSKLLTKDFSSLLSLILETITRKHGSSQSLATFWLHAAGTLVEATGFVGREAAKAHQYGGIKFKWLNQQLVGGGK